MFLARCLFLTALFSLVVIVAGCGQKEGPEIYSSKPVKAAGTAPITISINESQVDLSLDTDAYAAPPKNYKTLLACGKIKGDQMTDTVRGRTTWRAKETSAQVRMDAPVGANSDICQLYLDDNPPIIIFLNKDLEAKTGKDLSALESVRPN